ncbi:MAG: hypothetical protein NVV63_01970 [Opitutus sp.]|nr:hypothetical protein [Opitutus sp.]
MPMTNVPSSTQLYQSLLAAAMRGGKPESALDVFRAVAYDPEVHYDAALKLIQLISSIGATRRDAQLARQQAGLGGRCGIIVFQPWFYFDWVELVRKTLANGWFTPVFAASRCTGRRSLEGLTPGSVRHFAHKGRVLWKLCQYPLSLHLRALPEEIDPQEPAQFSVIKRIFAEAAEMIDEADDFVAAYQPEVVLLAQGYHLIAAVMRDAAIRSGIRVVAVENTLRKDLLVWEDICGIAVNTHLAQNYYWRLGDLVDDVVATRSTENYLASLSIYKTAEHNSPSGAALPEIPGGPVIVYLAQVGTDASVVFGRRGVTSQIDAIHATADYARKHGATLIVKLHPKECATFKTDEPFYRELTKGWLARDERFSACRDEMGNRLIVDTENSFSTYGLISRADVCVTMNSQAGLEALLMGKEVLLCGSAYYGGLGFTHEADDARAVAPALDRVLNEGLRKNDHRACCRFFHVFTEYYCIPKELDAFLALLAGPPSFPLVGESVPTARLNGERSLASVHQG